MRVLQEYLAGECASPTRVSGRRMCESYKSIWQENVRVLQEYLAGECASPTRVSGRRMCESYKSIWQENVRGFIP